MCIRIGRNASPQNSDYNKPIVIIGDSIIKNIDPRRLSKKAVRKFTYPGKTEDQISEEVMSINVNGDPAHVIVHAGTNNLPTDSAQRCAEVSEVKISEFKNSSFCTYS